MHKIPIFSTLIPKDTARMENVDSPRVQDTRKNQSDLEIAFHQYEKDDLGLSFLDLIILHLLDSAPVTGYLLRKRLASQFGLKSSYGTIYPRLKSFEKDQLIRIFTTRQSVEKSFGVNYELTPYGKSILARNLYAFDYSLKRAKGREVSYARVMPDTLSGLD
jgi:DNA-binding PadR family transcriptional regulator